MKSLKLSACLVALFLAVAPALHAASAYEYREWTDLNGRTITARLAASPSSDTIKIQRKDGQVFTVSLKTFSAADQAYIKNLNDTVAYSTSTGKMIFLQDADTPLWSMLKAGGHQSEASYVNTRLALILEGINERLATGQVKTASGSLLNLRTEPAELGEQIKITGDMPRMTLDGFIREVARINDLKVKTDPSGLVVLIDSSAQPGQPATASYFGVSGPN